MAYSYGIINEEEIMNIKEITKEEFDSFSQKHMLGSFYQTSAYGNVMESEGYTAIYVGGFKDEELMALTRTNSNSLEIAKNIIVEALHRGSQDNISCFVINL